jgi:2-keto-3-deoxy-galactonokinase
MGQDASPVGATAHPVSIQTPAPLPEDPALLRAEIERTRLELGETVAALAEKTDVKARAKEKMADVRQNVQAKRTALMGKARDTSPDGATSAAVQVRAKAQQNPVPTAALAAFVGGLLLGRITKRR